MEARQYRAAAAAVLAVLLVALVALVSTVGDQGEGPLELLQSELQAKDAADGGASKSSASSPAGSSTVSGRSSDSMETQLKSLKHTYGREQSLVGKIDTKVDKAELAQKKTLLAAKHLLNSGMEDELKAKMDVDRASKMRGEAQKLKDESEAARRKFVAQEHPVLLAQKLAEHDHKKYRSEELAVAKEVALLSEHPSSKNLRAKVDKLVKRSKQAKRRMAEDGMLLKKLEKKTADAQLGGSKGYSELKQKSVKIAKKAENIAEEAVSLAKKGHTEKVKARAEIKQVKKALKKPDKEHERAEKDEKKAKKTHKVIKEIQKKIESEEASKAAKREAKEEKKKEKKMSSYSEERKRLREEVESKSTGATSKKSKKAHESDEQKQLMAAKDSYDELEQLEEKKEKARLRREEKREGKAKTGDDSLPARHKRDAVASEKAAKIKDAEKRAHILSERQSTFLSGLFSTKSPWDTSKGLRS